MKKSISIMFRDSSSILKKIEKELISSDSFSVEKKSDEITVEFNDQWAWISWIKEFKEIEVTFSSNSSDFYVINILNTLKKAGSYIFHITFELLANNICVINNFIEKSIVDSEKEIYFSFYTLNVYIEKRNLHKVLNNIEKNASDYLYISENNLIVSKHNKTIDISIKETTNFIELKLNNIDEEEKKTDLYCIISYIKDVLLPSFHILAVSNGTYSSEDLNLFDEIKILG